MAVPSATGHPAYSGTFIPEVWSGNLVDKFYDATVFGEICNTDYEGDISDMGDKVHIRTVPSITIRAYEKGQDLEYENPESPNVELVVDKARYFGFACDDIDAYQTDLDLMDNWSEDASEQMKIEIDSDILADVWADADAANTGATAGRKSEMYDMGETGAPVSLTKENIIDYLVDAGSVLDEQSVPESDRWIILPAKFTGMIKKSDLKDASLSGDSESIVRNGRVGRIDRFMVYQSNNLPIEEDDTDRVFPCIFGHKSAVTFASQMTKMDTLKSEKRFSQLVRGLNVYGYEVIKPESMGVLYATAG